MVIELWEFYSLLGFVCIMVYVGTSIILKLHKEKEELLIENRELQDKIRYLENDVDLWRGMAWVLSNDLK